MQKKCANAGRKHTKKKEKKQVNADLKEKKEKKNIYTFHASFFFLLNFSKFKIKMFISYTITRVNFFCCLWNLFLQIKRTKGFKHYLFIF